MEPIAVGVACVRVLSWRDQSFYYHLKRMQSPDRHARLRQAIREIFDTSDQRYGYRRVRFRC